LFLLVCSVCSSFFFSSRRRHTRSKRDWSSDVCSSDLVTGHVSHILAAYYNFAAVHIIETGNQVANRGLAAARWSYNGRSASLGRSEERRVGKEWRCRWAACAARKIKQGKSTEEGDRVK